MSSYCILVVKVGFLEGKKKKLPLIGTKYAYSTKDERTCCDRLMGEDQLICFLFFSEQFLELKLVLVTLVCLDLKYRNMAYVPFANYYWV